MIGTLPPVYLPENKKYSNDGEFFKNYAYFIARFYNTQTPRSINGWAGQGNNVVNDSQGANSWWGNNPIGNMIIYYQYYMGSQPINDYWYSYCDENNIELNTVKIRGQKIAELLKHMEGKSEELLQALIFDTTNISPGAESRRLERIEKARFQNALKQFGLLDIGAGVQFDPLSGVDSASFDIPEKFYEYLEHDFKENFEIVCTRIAKALSERNRFQEHFKQVFKQALVGGISATEPYVSGGRVKIRGYEPYQVIWDNTNLPDDPQNRKARFVGLLDYLTPSQVLEEFGPELEKRKQYDALKTIESVRDNTGIAQLQSLPDSTINVTLNNNGKPVISVLRTYFKALKDTRYTVTKDGYGDDNILELKEGAKSKSAKGKEEGDFRWETWYKCTLIGNITHANYGECYNNVENPFDAREVECPVKVWIPDITLGAAKSMVARLYQHQDRKDFLENEITKKLNLSLGRSYIIRGSKLKGVNVKDLFNDFKRYNLSVLDYDDDDPYNNVDGKSLTETVDMTLDPNVQYYIQLKAEEDKMMEEIASISKMDLGMQRTYVSLNTQQTTIGQSSLGTKTWFTTFLTHIVNVTQHMVNMQKNLIAEHGDNEDFPLLSRLDRELLKEVEDISSEQIGIYLKANDAIDESIRQRLLSYAQAWSQNPVWGITPVDIVKMEQSKTLTELVNMLDYAVKRGERQQAMAAQQQQMQQQELEQAKLASKEAVAGLQADTKLQEAQMNNEGKIADTITKQIPIMMSEDSPEPANI